MQTGNPCAGAVETVGVATIVGEPDLTTVATADVGAGLAPLVMPRRFKSPRSNGWQLEPRAIRSHERAAMLNGRYLGLARRRSGTRAEVLHDYHHAGEWLAARRIDLHMRLLADAAVQIRSGRPNRARLVYRRAPGAPGVPTCKLEGAGLLPRWAGRYGSSTVQDLLPPRVQPGTRQPYVWAGAGDASRAG